MKTQANRMNVASFVLLTIYSVYAQAKNSLDNSTDNKCGQTLKIHPNDEIVLTSSGRAPKNSGFCSAVVYAVGKEDQNCHGICVSVSSQHMDVCHAKVQFKGMDFGKDDDPYRELSCFSRLPVEWCFHNNVMTVEIVETFFYANEVSTSGYNFNVKVVPLCDNSPYGKDIEAREAAERERDADARTNARIHGILVGVCLAIVFLIVLLITWCYYKNKPFRRDIHNYPTAHVRKGPTLAGFKAKMTFHKGSSSDDCEAKPKKEKKPKHSKDEASTENEDTKPKKRGGLRFLNKLRSNKAEEVPLVEKKDEKADDADKPDEKIEEIKDDETVEVKQEKEDKAEDNKDDEKEAAKPEDDKKDENEGEVTQSGNAGTGDKDEKSSNEQVSKIDTPSVTVTTPGDNENDSKNDSSDDS